jgi:hypothetical protein
MARTRSNRYLTLSTDAASRLATVVAAWQTAHPGIDATGVVERLIAAEFDEIDADIVAAGQYAAGGQTREATEDAEGHE